MQMLPTTVANIQKFRGSEPSQQEDILVTEEPLEIRLGFSKAGVRQQKSISVTMRTPGHDEELALGFLFTEGILHSPAQVKEIYRPALRRKTAHGNVLVVDLADGESLNFKRLERHFYTSSSCGVCGKASIEAVEVQSQYELPAPSPMIEAALLHQLPDLLCERQKVFGSTGGLHAAGLFSQTGELHYCREDVGRHNAVDKLIGHAFRQGNLPLSECLVLVSGRLGFELVQKSVVAGVPMLAAVGAPTSLAVQLADEAGMTLVGFLRDGQFNVYTHGGRVSG